MHSVAKAFADPSCLALAALAAYFEIPAANKDAPESDANCAAGAAGWPYPTARQDSAQTSLALGHPFRMRPGHPAPLVQDVLLGRPQRHCQTHRREDGTTNSGGRGKTTGLTDSFPFHNSRCSPAYSSPASSQNCSGSSPCSVNTDLDQASYLCSYLANHPLRHRHHHHLHHRACRHPCTSSGFDFGPFHLGQWTQRPAAEGVDAVAASLDHADRALGWVLRLKTPARPSACSCPGCPCPHTDSGSAS
mmetsp:Transcript_55564/g.119270  ORF Transcript_55564/g.119270 Transcript_55564/m.119270 type:complete len:248 (-) Transcript_55564:264-1007(-)